MTVSRFALGYEVSPMLLGDVFASNAAQMALAFKGAHRAIARQQAGRTKHLRRVAKAERLALKRAKKALK
jgi:uncharacterized ParB-like nuclease family protein